jgi:hypothetical protein
VPRQTVNQNNLGFRRALGPEFRHYDVANIEELNAKLVGRQFRDIFLSLHFEPLDVSGILGETSWLEDVAFRSFSASLSATWRLTDNPMLSPWTYVQEINTAIDEAQPTSAVHTDQFRFWRPWASYRSFSSRGSRWTSKICAAGSR